MQCFVHPNLAASAVCKKCGKAMCVDCSAFANHSGLCPNCRKDSIAEGLRKINGIRKANIWVILILSVFILAGVGVTYFLLYDNPLVFAACAAVPFLFVYLFVKLKKLKSAKQALQANLAQINHALGKAPPHTGIINPLNIYQDLDACKTAPREEKWSQLAFIEPVPEEIPEYQAGVSEVQAQEAPQATEKGGAESPHNEADGAEAPDIAQAMPSEQVSEQEEFVAPSWLRPTEGTIPDIDELQLAASKLVADDELFEGQITFKEVLEQILYELNLPLEEIEKPRPKQPRPAARPPVKPSAPQGETERRAVRRPVPVHSQAAETQQKRTAVKSAEKQSAPAEPPKNLRPAPPKDTAKTPDKAAPAAQPATPPRPRPLYTEEEKKYEKERADMRKELLKLREQINELYNKNR